MDWYLSRHHIPGAKAVTIDIKRKYRDMLNNEILAGDPISWMKDDTEFVVMTAVSGRSRRNEYGKVALCEVTKGVTPKMIGERARGMVFIWELHNHVRLSGRKGSHQIITNVRKRCAELNAKVAELNAKASI
jgi:hypothetical protein